MKYFCSLPNWDAPFYRLQNWDAPDENFVLKGDFTNLYIADFNGDGRSDILRQEKGSWDDDAHRTAEVLVSRGDGDFGFTRITLHEHFFLKGDWTNLHIGDFNGDGRSDMLRQEKGSADDDAHTTAQVFLSQTTATLTPSPPSPCMSISFLRATLPICILATLMGTVAAICSAKKRAVGTTMPI
ncbi:MAG: VCBS repeat-containing protein [Hormoscilla sp. GM7CHS1pb]|nr:VCBS repeat-containing protein [Hormoscilla sp. GM7CHS1pb]